MEAWHAIPGFPAVEASSLGRIRTKQRQVAQLQHSGAKYVRTLKSVLLKPWLTHGYETVQYGLVSRLVCLAFHGEPPEGKPNALHANGCSTDNRPDNLYWGDQTQNAADSIKHGVIKTGHESHKAKLAAGQREEIKLRRLAGERCVDLAKEFDISPQRVTDIMSDR